MSKNIEIESKILLSESEYEIVHLFLKENQEYLQTNYYFDTDKKDLLNKDLFLRMRDKDNVSELTIKSHLKEGLLEINQTISKQEASSFLKGDWPEGEIKKLISEAVSLDKVHLITKLETWRIDFPYEGGLISLDKNKYGNVTDFEIEFEYSSKKEGDILLLKFLDSLGIKNKSLNKLSKVRRAYSII